MILDVNGVMVDFGEAPVWRKSTQAAANPSAGDVEVAMSPDGYVALRGGTDATILTFTPQEWDAWLRGAKAGEFEV